MNARPRFGLITLALLAVLLFSNFMARQVQANSSVNVDIGIFHDALAPYGNWVNHQTYGQVWYPLNVARDWRPYTDGYWAHTHDYGWLWVSYEPWGWAPFHYGRWAWDSWYGWVWVPGRTWAPAWVFWRSGGGYAAWAPMPPNVVWQPGVGLNISYFNYDRDLSWDSWVAVREYDLPHQHMSRHIYPSSQNRQVINVTNYTNNVTLINNTIVNQGVPINQIEEITRKPVVSVVPTVLNKVDVNTVEHHDGQPNIVQLPMPTPTSEEIHHNEELARRLDGKNQDGTRTELSAVADLGQPGNQEPRVPGRLVGAPAPVESPYATPEQPNPALSAPVEQVPPQPVIPETPLVGLSLDSDTQNKALEASRNQEALIPAQPSDQQSSATIQPIAPVSPETAGALTPVPVVDQQSVSTETPPVPPLQNEQQPLESAKQSNDQPLQEPVVDQQQIERPKTESSIINLQRQQQIDQLQELEIQQQQEANRQQDGQIQQQQAERAAVEAQQNQQQEAARQQALVNQQQQEIQQQQAEREGVEAQQNQQQEAARQQALHNQQQQEIQQQQAERAAAETQQSQQQEAVRQQALVNQQQQEIQQQQQAEREGAEAQQNQQQEAARQQALQNQQQQEIEQQQAERTKEDAQQQTNP